MAHHEYRFAARDGLPLYGQAWVPEGEPRAAMVVVHGMTEHGGRYARLADDLNRRGYAVYALDLRGHGRSGGDRVYIRSFDEYLNDVEAWLEQVAAAQPGKPLCLFGHSMGGLVVATLCIRRLPDVRGIILSAPAVVVSAFPVLRRLAGLAGALCPRLRLTRMGCRYLSRDPAIVEAFRNDPLVFHGRFPARTGAEVLRATRQIPVEAGRLALPLLIFQGTGDRAVDPQGSRLLASRAGSNDKTLRLYEGLYHEVFSEPEREQLVADLIAWLDGHC